MRPRAAHLTRAAVVKIIIFLIIVLLSPVALVASFRTMKTQNDTVQQLKQQNAELMGKCFAVWVMDESAYLQLKTTDTIQLKLK